MWISQNVINPEDFTRSFQLVLNLTHQYPHRQYTAKGNADWKPGAT